MTATWPESAPPSLVLLAAGRSSRLGSPKALAPLPRGTPLMRLLAAWPLEQPPPIVVTGYHHAEILRALKNSNSKAQALHHPDWELGRTGSLQAALRQLGQRDIMVAPVDCPRIPRPVFVALLEAWQAADCPAQGWCAPFVLERGSGKKVHGHPILIGRGLAEQALSMEPDAPLRGLRRSAQPCFDVAVPYREILEDLDTSEDLERLCREDRQSP